ncbi:MAG TPA: class I SAM-dependent methyltransferase [Cyanobacteria bacterium UBA8156]|jgi:2-polyprenyl-3-methyl-5-hydroxy-6-metoxy-1,4-benzoquinol methylase|nr:class I SAM-dependent methyltransferase [Cyanobacteria bacterium UBA8156]
MGVNLPAAFQRLQRGAMLQGTVELPCVPALGDAYLEWVCQLFALLGSPFPESRLPELRDRLVEKLTLGFTASQHARLVLTYQPAPPPQPGLVLDVQVRLDSLKSFYEQTIQTHFGDRLDEMETGVFGRHPNAKVMDVAAQLPAASRILDVGAGAGRNTLPLARQGFRVDALELAEIFSHQLQVLSDREGLPVQVTQGDILDPARRLPRQTYDLVLFAEVFPHFRSPQQIRLAALKAYDALQPEGFLLFNSFVGRADWEPTPVDRQVAAVSQAFFTTERELTQAMAGLPLVLVSREPVFDYERDRLPPAAWPPSPWFADWTTGRLVFPDTEPPPIALEWLCYRRLTR